jgi:hypothetical protein
MYPMVTLKEFQRTVNSVSKLPHFGSIPILLLFVSRLNNFYFRGGGYFTEWPAILKYSVQNYCHSAPPPPPPPAATLPTAPLHPFLRCTHFFHWRFVRNALHPRLLPPRIATRPDAGFLHLFASAALLQPSFSSPLLCWPCKPATAFSTSAAVPITFTRRCVTGLMFCV